MINDRTISATSTVSAALWVIGGALVIVGAFFDLWFTGIGLYVSGIGGCMSIRRMFCMQAHREVAAFELGRDVERTSRELRSI